MTPEVGKAVWQKSEMPPPLYHSVQKHETEDHFLCMYINVFQNAEILEKK